MIGNKYLMSMERKLNFTLGMIETEISIEAESDHERKVYKEIPKLLKQIKQHLSSDEIGNNADYELYMKCKSLISYWND